MVKNIKNIQELLWLKAMMNFSLQSIKDWHEFSNRKYFCMDCFGIFCSASNITVFESHKPAGFSICYRKC